MKSKINRPDRTGHFVHGIMETFKLEEVISWLRNEAEYKDKGHNALTLTKDTTLSTVLVCIQKNQKLHEHHAPGPFTLTMLRGSISFILEPHAENITTTLAEGELLVLGDNLPHEVVALEDSAFVLTIALKA